MKNVSVVALLVGALLTTGALAQDVSVSVDVSVSASGEVSVSVDPSSVLSSLESEVSSAVSSASSELSSELSSASSELSSAVSSASSELSSSEGGGNGMSQEPTNCGTGTNDLDINGMMLGPMDAAALAAVTSVTVFTVGDCSGLGAIDGGTQATLGTHPAVVAALAAAGETGAEIVAYALDDASLTVFVKRR